MCLPLLHTITHNHTLTKDKYTYTHNGLGSIFYIVRKMVISSPLAFAWRHQVVDTIYSFFFFGGASLIFLCVCVRLLSRNRQSDRRSESLVLLLCSYYYRLAYFADSPIPVVQSYYFRQAFTIHIMLLLLFGYFLTLGTATNFEMLLYFFPFLITTSTKLRMMFFSSGNIASHSLFLSFNVFRLSQIDPFHNSSTCFHCHLQHTVLQHVYIYVN